MTDSHALLGEALEHHQAGRHDQAATLYRRALEIDPDEPTALYLFGLLNFEAGQTLAALDLLSKVVKLRPDHAQAGFTLANLRHWRGDYAQAVAGYRAVLELQPDHVAARIGLAKALRDDGELDEAAAECRAALDLDPSSADAYDALGGVLTALGRLGLAIDAYRAAIALQPDIASPRIGLAMALVGEDRPREALEAADAALAIDRNLADAWFARGSALEAMRRLDEAAAALETAVALDPGQALSQLRLGNVYGELQRGEEAIKALREAISLDPTLKEAHASLGSLYFLTGQKAEAERFSWLALAIDPDMIAPRLNLASMLAERGDLVEAKAHRDAAYGRQNLFVETAPDPRRRVLILSTAESGNVPFKYLLPRERYTRINWIVEYADEGQVAGLPAYDVVFNAIGDPDLAGPTEAPVARFLETCAAPVFNDPVAVLRTFRHQTPELLAGLAGVTAPRTVRLAAEDVSRMGLTAAVTAANLTWPVMIRPIGSHGGQGLIRVDSAAELILAKVPAGQDLYLTAFHDFRSLDGGWRKYRIIFVDRVPYPYHLAISNRWLVHHGTADMLKRPERLAEELRFLEDPEAAIGAAAMEAVAQIGQRLNLDYCGVDFSVLPNGAVLVFEANANMLVHPEAADSPLAPKNPYVKRILDAVEAMIAP
ncbi:MAG TPA: tetratricopeptide repeat protein [Caulobacteraceae bacterium]|jgi:tetratricopeptide (TPR) repeat protein|nr:tetratricopeptide repeat protein [Caulobacteraceae bacterium]